MKEQLFDSLYWPGQCKVGIVAVPLYPYVQMRCIHFRPRGDPSGPLYLEKISPAPVCGRERASLTVLTHITHSDTQKSVLTHSNEWVSPE